MLKPSLKDWTRFDLRRRNVKELEVMHRLACKLLERRGPAAAFEYLSNPVVAEHGSILLAGLVINNWPVPEWIRQEWAVLERAGWRRPSIHDLPEA